MRFPEFKEEWELHPTTDFFEFKNGLNPDSKRFGSGTKFISVMDILNNRYITYDKIKAFVEPKGNDLNEFGVNYGDVLFQRSSETLEYVGRANVYLDKKTALFGGFVIRGKKIGEYNPLFFRYLLSSPHARKRIVVKGAGAQHFNIGQDGLSKISIFVPTTKEQERIAKLLDLIDERIETQNRIIEDLEQLRSILNEKLIRHLNINEYKIEDVCSTIACKAYIKNKYLEHGEYPIIQQGEKPIIGYADGTPFCEYDKAVLFGDHTLSLYRPVSPFFIATDGIKVLITKENVLRDYLYYAIATYMPKSEGYKRHYNILKDVFIPVPPRDEQEAIARHLSVYDEKIETEYKILHLYKMQKQYLLNHMFI